MSCTPLITGILSCMQWGNSFVIHEGMATWSWSSSYSKKAWNPTSRAFTTTFQSFIAQYTVAMCPSLHMCWIMCIRTPTLQTARPHLWRLPWKQATPKWFSYSLLKELITLLAMCWTICFPNNLRPKSPASTQQSTLAGKLPMHWLLRTSQLRIARLRRL